MSIEYCHRGGHYIDLDFDCDGQYIGTEWVCWDCLTDQECEKLEEEES